MFADLPILSLLIWLPILGGVWILTAGKDAAKPVSLIVSIAAFVLSLPLYFEFDTTTHAMQFTELTPWISVLGINYHLGVDGKSVDPPKREKNRWHPG